MSESNQTQQLRPIFALEAIRYWERDLPAIPLNQWNAVRTNKDTGVVSKLGKAPIIKNWQRFSLEGQTHAERQKWLLDYPYGNIGFVAGPYSGIGFFDIDVNNEKVDQLLLQVCKKVVWKRVGAKGSMWAVKLSPQLRNTPPFKISSTEGMLLEFLYKGNQIVLPGSIHPDTNQPYQANCHLVDVLDELPVIHMQDFESFLRAGLKDLGYTLRVNESSRIRVTEKVAKGNRDNSMIRAAGLFAYEVLARKLTLQEAIDRLDDYLQTMIQNDSADPIDYSKGINKLFECLERDIKGEKKKRLPAGWDRELDPEYQVLAKQMFGDEFIECTVEQLINEINDFRHEHGLVMGADTANRKLQEILDKAARSPGILENPIAVESLASHAAKQFDVLGLQKGVIKSVMVKSSNGGVPGTDHYQIGNRLLKDMEEYGPVRYPGDDLYQWVGCNWEKIPDPNVLKMIGERFGNLPAARKYSDHLQILKLTRNLANGPLCQVDAKGVNFANGFLNHRLELEPHHPDHGCTYILNYDYDASGAIPRKFERFLQTLWGDEPDFTERREALYQAICCTFFGLAPRFKRAFLFYGPSHSGKTTLLEVVRGLFAAESQCHVPPEKWNARFLATDLVNKIINFCRETSENIPIDGKTFKEVVEGSPMQVERKGRDPFTFSPTVAHFFAGNFLPITRDTSTGFTRRFLTWTFNKQVPKDSSINDFESQILAEERHLIAAEACRRLPYLLQPDARLCVPASSLAIEDFMAKKNNSVRLFLCECNDILVAQKAGADPEQHRALEEKLYMAYLSFATARNIKWVTHQPFRNMMNDLKVEFGLRVVTQQGRGGNPQNEFVGISILKKSL